MKPNRIGQLLLTSLLATTLIPRTVEACGSALTAPAHMVVAAQARRGGDRPAVNREDVLVYQGKGRDQVTNWIPLQGDRAALQFVILIDDAANTVVCNQFGDVRSFIISQPESTAVGVAYMRNGTVEIVQNLTTEHARAAQALRLPLENSGAFGSLYLSMVDILGLGSPISFAPHLEDLSRRLNQQYEPEFLAKAEKKPSLQPARVRTEENNVEIDAADSVWVPAATQ
ncbi:MAG TPA: hypothetical protein VHX49_15430 [Candidatus Acidoferrales bacterium]|jgi:hypothetical protein|nr:hypothetical protein [Candidatus Acidoferrales bacterium]